MSFLSIGLFGNFLRIIPAVVLGRMQKHLCVYYDGFTSFTVTSSLIAGLLIRYISCIVNNTEQSFTSEYSV